MLSELKSKIIYTSQRHALLSSNVGNINTPGFKSKDLKPFYLSQALKSHIPMFVTHKMHIPISGNSKFRSFEPKDTDVKVDGNNVSIESQSFKIGSNSFEHKKAIDMYNKSASLIRMAMQNEKKGS